MQIKKRVKHRQRMRGRGEGGKAHARRNRVERGVRGKALGTAGRLSRSFGMTVARHTSSRALHVDESEASDPLDRHSTHANYTHEFIVQ